jgi:2-dehydropantoate 2-reductase
MPVDIIGAGAMGGILGAYLARGGVSVRFFDTDRAHVDAICQDGLRIRGIHEFTVRAPAMRLADVADELDTVVLAVKAQHVGDALSDVAHHLAPDGRVVCVQNGLAAHEVARRIGPQRTIPASVSYAGHRVGPGEILHGASGGLAIGTYCRAADDDRVRSLAGLLAPFGDVEVEQNIWGVIWTKLALAGIYAATAVDGRPMPEIFADRQARRVLSALAAEIVETGLAEGVELIPVKGLDVGGCRFAPRDDASGLERMWGRLLLLASEAAERKPHSGVYYDLAVLHRPTEVEAMLGPVVNRAQRLGRSARLMPHLIATINELERDHTRMSPRLLLALADEQSLGR